MVALVWLSFLLITPLAIAQVVIEPEDIPLQIGSQFPYGVIEDLMEGIEVDLGEGGADEVWDFSAFTPDRFTGLYQDSLVDPNEAPYREEFPNANRVVYTPQDPFGFALGDELAYGYLYQTVTDTGWFMVGVASPPPPDGDTLFPLVWRFQRPVPILPLPARRGEEFNSTFSFSFGLRASDVDDSLGAIFDSIYFHWEIGGFSTIDGWGVFRTVEDDLPALRTYTLWGGRLWTTGVRTIFGRRIEIELFSQELEAQHVYRWFSPDLGEVGAVASMPGEQDPNFSRASYLRVRWVGPRLQLDRPELSFGVVELGRSREASLTISNPGRSELIIERVDFDEDIFHEMDILTGLPLRISPESSADLVINWTPSQERSLEGYNTYLWHNDPRQESPLAIPMRGYTPLSANGPNRSFPSSFTLTGPYPNPLNGLAIIHLAVPEGEMGVLSLTDVRGRLLWQEQYAPGHHSLSFPMPNVPAGQYLFILTTSSGRSISQRAVIVK